MWGEGVGRCCRRLHTCVFVRVCTCGSSIDVPVVIWELLVQVVTYKQQRCRRTIQVGLILSQYSSILLLYYSLFGFLCTMIMGVATVRFSCTPRCILAYSNGIHTARSTCSNVYSLDNSLHLSSLMSTGIRLSLHSNSTRAFHSNSQARRHPAHRADGADARRPSSSPSSILGRMSHPRTHVVLASGYAEPHHRRAPSHKTRSTISRSI